MSSYDRDCTCPHEERPLGRLHGVNMGRGMLRIATTPGCPEHDSCRGYTKAYRAADPRGRYLYCPIHTRKVCPDVDLS